MSDERVGKGTLGRSAPGEGAALLVIDVQQGLFAKPTPIYRGTELLATIAELIQRAHREGALVVYVQHSSDRVLPYGSDGWRLHPSLSQCRRTWSSTRPTEMPSRALPWPTSWQPGVSGEWWSPGW